MTADPTLIAARARALAARQRLDASLAQAKDRLNPRSLAADAVDGARDKAVEVAQTGLQVARERPAVAAAVVGAIGLVLARKPLAGWVGAHLGRDDATPDAPTS